MSSLYVTVQVEVTISGKLCSYGCPFLMQKPPYCKLFHSALGSGEGGARRCRECIENAVATKPTTPTPKMDELVQCCLADECVDRDTCRHGQPHEPCDTCSMPCGEQTHLNGACCVATKKGATE